ncbi:NAD(P)-dependent dehydrogenase, short-chain alcohol dehydrogenase family [Paucidesulfovibrio gracilis DSM 16080]|uniref:NAD(P)-dependent dehydrogenase, short-chain alcohol dehydrogenase family n=1 Tax=Paucidesulfovibrio gracilis DSM 16080 TaxID=1121449 RepID=A0A1T4X2D0_9BACT|nr:SDR family oxidoreductase [Paucidesulfovibrio gracilis]SKA83750.1 NAD(P)-dependent dehydrogenase, short-chain alcohol dehydrogenase family [Paucidesulfovibrio gracilis DSM 16080]
MSTVLERFALDNKVVIITGGCGLLGRKHAEAVMESGGTAVLWDIVPDADRRARDAGAAFPDRCAGMQVDITNPESIATALAKVLNRFGRVDALINNAANDPKVSKEQGFSWSRFENFDRTMWDNDIAVGLTGAFLCSQAVGAHMAAHGGGVILNIASDLGVIAPDQRIYRQDGLADAEQPVKPVTYSVVKHGLVGLTKYMATYWADQGVRVNALSPGGVRTNQPDDFVERLTNLIPMGRMAGVDEYKGAVLFLISEASSYMTGANLSVDGGRTTW